LKHCSPRCPTGIRNRALLVVLWRGMVRVSEALALKPSDFDGDSIRVLRGKGDKARVVGIDPQASAVIEKWLSHRKEKLGFNGGKRLFCTLAGKPMQTVYVRNLMKRLGKKAGIDKRVHAHGLRHSGASELLSEGANVGIISKQLGHASIATTHRYLNHINPAEVIEAMGRRTWGTAQEPKN
jgi:site-specific recombinase XerD